MREVLTKEYLSTLKPLEVAYPKGKSGELLFPKPVKDKRDIGWTKKKQTIRHKKNKQAHKGRSVLKFSLPKEKTRSQLIKILDGMVSNYILVKVCKGKCMRCGKQHVKTTNDKWLNYGCSHFWARTYMGTRWEVDNLDGLGWLPCHASIWEHDKNGQYRDYMLKKLGNKRYKELEIKARSVTKFSTLDIKLLIQNFDKIWK